MHIKERLADVVDGYCLDHSGRLPLRLTVSAEVAGELDAALAGDNGRFDPFAVSHRRPLDSEAMEGLLCREGHIVYFRGIPVVCDLTDEEVVDVRDAED